MPEDLSYFISFLAHFWVSNTCNKQYMYLQQFIYYCRL